jgi:hypothetical protein
MPFRPVAGAILNMLRKSLQLEIDGFMELLDPSIEKPMTKQAFSKARQKILPSAFSFLFDDGVAMLQDRDIIAAAAIDTTARDERSLAKEHLEYFKPFKREKDLEDIEVRIQSQREHFDRKAQE